MVKQEDFDVEQFMDKYETNIVNNMGETCCDSLSAVSYTHLDVYKRQSLAGPLV